MSRTEKYVPRDRCYLDAWTVQELAWLANLASQIHLSWQLISVVMQHFGGLYRPHNYYHWRKCADQYIHLLKTIRVPRSLLVKFPDETQSAYIAKQMKRGYYIQRENGVKFITIPKIFPKEMETTSISLKNKTKKIKFQLPIISE